MAFSTPPPPTSARDPNGRYGNLFNTYVSPAGSGRWESPTPNWTPQSAGLPDYLARQFSQTTVNTGGDGGQDQTVWQVGNGGVYQDSSGANVVQVGDPSKWGQPNQPNLRDRSKVHYDEDLGYVTDPGNLIDDFHENGWDRFMTHVAIPGIIAAAGGMAGAGIMSGAAGAAGGAPASAASVTGGFQTGADIAGTAAAGEAGGTAGAAAGAAPEIAGPPADLAPPPEVGPPANLAPPPEVGPPADLAPPPEAPPASTPSGIPADVVDHSLPSVVDHSVTSDGLINGVRGTANSLGTWYNNLSPASRFVLGQAVSQGTKGIMGAAAQRQAQQAAREAEERHRQDVIRRGQVPILPPGTFTPKPPGG